MYLVHHGIKGQKWGVRRFENEDGTLTEEGKKRYKKYQRNEDSEFVAREKAREYNHLSEIVKETNAVKQVIHRVATGEIKKEDADKVYDLYARNLQQFRSDQMKTNASIIELDKKYKKVNYDYYAEAKTGEVYCQSLLTDKMGNQYLSEIYTGNRVVDKKFRKDTKL